MTPRSMVPVDPPSTVGEVKIFNERSVTVQVQVQTATSVGAAPSQNSQMLSVGPNGSTTFQISQSPVPARLLVDVYDQSGVWLYTFGKFGVGLRKGNGFYNAEVHVRPGRVDVMLQDQNGATVRTMSVLDASVAPGATINVGTSGDNNDAERNVLVSLPYLADATGNPNQGTFNPGRQIGIQQVSQVASSQGNWQLLSPQNTTQVLPACSFQLFSGVQDAHGCSYALGNWCSLNGQLAGQSGPYGEQGGTAAANGTTPDSNDSAPSDVVVLIYDGAECLILDLATGLALTSPSDAVNQSQGQLQFVTPDPNPAQPLIAQYWELGASGN